MEKDRINIHFTVIENGIKIPISSRHGSYPNLMCLLKDELLLESFGECGGVGRCATCVVKTKGITGNSAIKDRKEPATLSKLGLEEDNIRLSCQIFITADLDGAEIEILEI